MNASKTIISILVLLVTLAGCNNKKTAKDLLVNKWKVIKISGGRSAEMPDSVRQKVLKNLSMEFTRDGYYILAGMDSTIHKGTYTVSDDELTLTMTPAATGKPEKNTLNEVVEKELIITDESGTRLESVPVK